MTRISTVEDRFFDKLSESSTGCWRWIARRDRDGYGQFRVNRRTVVAHRWAYEFLVGEIPEGLVLDHLCRERSCVNPFHLDPVTVAENVRRAQRPDLLTHCANRHPWTPESLYLSPGGGRVCRLCKRGRRGRQAAPS
ncbi:HNH endonuclease signature motif containing protein [Rhodococcus sp. 2G]|uniref:HNH endonuclease signature motif containing protein n=1 Tax=Rhodococcus sp. 2G TaxID=1570939 RepID=UPI0009FB01BF